MITAAEVARAIQGCWRLARLDPSGMDFFDKTIDGFWRSFWVAALVAPAYLVLRDIQLSVIEVTAGPLRHIAAELIAFAILWVAYPLAMFHLTRLMDRSEKYVGYIVAYNWSHIFQFAFLLPILLMVPNEPAVPGAWATFILAANLVVFLYVGYIAKTALNISTMMAAGVVALDVALLNFISGIRDTILISG
jgi:hypothetical protein